MPVEGEVESEKKEWVRNCPQSNAKRGKKIKKRKE
jgi:hypothetical protein